MPDACDADVDFTCISQIEEIVNLLILYLLHYPYRQHCVKVIVLSKETYGITLIAL